MLEPSQKKYNELIQKIESNSMDIDVQILHLKERGLSCLNSLELCYLLTAIRHNTSVQILYLQNLGPGFNDAVLGELAFTLQKNLNIWGLNLGEMSNHITRRSSWDCFEASLPKTNLSFLFIDKDCCDKGRKSKIKEVLRVNRRKHVRWYVPSNYTVSERVGKMWWNPSSSENWKIFNRFEQQKYILVKKKFIEKYKSHSYDNNWAGGYEYLDTLKRKLLN